MKTCEEVQIKPTEYYFPIVLFIMLFKVLLTFESVDEIYGVTIQMKPLKQCSHVIAFAFVISVFNEVKIRICS